MILRRDRRGVAAVEFGLVASIFILLILGEFEFGRMIWILQALQVTGQQTARCVAIGSTICSSPASYAVSVASAEGVVGLTTSGVQIATVSYSNATPTQACNPPSNNTMVKVTITLAFSSTVATLIPSLNQSLVSISCYPSTGV
jgi:Flp pilus assembly protein TadG